MSEIKQKALELCWKIEELPASELQTEVSIMASELKDEIEKRELPKKGADTHITLVICGVVPGENLREQFQNFFSGVTQLLQESFPEFRPDNPPVTLVTNEIPDYSQTYV